MANLPPAVFAATMADNERLSNAILFTCLSVVAALTVYNIVIHSVKYIRTLACLNNDNQRFFKGPQPIFSKVKRYLLDAPLFGRRHSKQMRVGSLEAGILPTRCKSLLLLGIIIMNIVLATYGMEWHGDLATLLMHLRNRVGSMAVTNMLPLILVAGRNSPLIKLTNISFNTYNVLHRWFGRIIISLAVVHATCEIYNMTLMAKTMHMTGVQAFTLFLNEQRFIMFGFISFIALMSIFLTSFTAFRHAFYETFLHIHIILVSLVLAGLWIHLAALPVQNLIKVVISIWVIERLIRLARLVYRNVGRTNTVANIETLPGDALRVTLRVARPWTFKPGQHIFLTVPTVGLWTSHPFSVAWSDYTSKPFPTSPDDMEKALPERTDSLLAPNPSTSVSLILRRRTGFTNHLHRRVDRANGTASLPALAEGPYGGTHILHSYGTVLLFAGGVGITHQVPFVRDLVAGYAAGTVAARRILLVWVIQSPEHLEWIRPWMTEILAMHKRRDVLRIQLFVTRPRSSKEIHSPSATVQMFPGKPNVDTIVEMDCREQIGAMGVSVCGPGGLADDVRCAVRRRQGGRSVDFLEEVFGW